MFPMLKFTLIKKMPYIFGTKLITKINFFIIFLTLEFLVMLISQMK